MKIKCPSCGFENKKEARFCENCEEPLPNPYIKGIGVRLHKFTKCKTKIE